MEHCQMQVGARSIDVTAEHGVDDGVEVGNAHFAVAGDVGAVAVERAAALT